MADNLFETDGMVEVGEQTTDFLLEGEVELPKLFNQDSVRYSYNQGKSKDCTLYSSFGAVSDLMNYEFSKKEIQEIIDLAISRGKDPDGGRNTQLGAKCVADYWNTKNPTQKIAYYRIDILSNNFAQVLKAGYTVVVSLRGNAEYSNDHYLDGVVDGVLFPNPTRGHATTSIYLDDNKVCIKDSYKGRKQKNGEDDNVYELRDIISLVKNGVYYSSAYVFIAEEQMVNNVEDLKRLKELEGLINQGIDINSNMWHKTNSESFKEDLHEMNNKLKMKLEDIKAQYLKFK